MKELGTPYHRLWRVTGQAVLVNFQERVSMNKIKNRFRNHIFIAPDNYTKEEEIKRVQYLKTLSLKQSAMITEELVVGQLGRDILGANRIWNKK